MSTRLYGLILKEKDRRFTRDIKLNNDDPYVHLINWVENEYGYSTTIEEIWWLRDDGVEERIR